MMSYLWILLLGSLLAASAKAQDDVAPTEGAAAPATQAAETVAASEVNEEPTAADEETDHTAKETPPTASEPELDHADHEAGAGEPVTPAVKVAEPETPAHDNAEPVTPAVEVAEPETPAVEVAEPETPAVEVAEPVTPAVEVAEPVTPAVEVAEPETPAVEVAEPVTPAVEVAEPMTPAVKVAEPVTPAEEDTETEAAATAPGPAADPEVKEPTAHNEEDATSNAGASPAQGESGSEATSAADPPEADIEEKPTDPAAAEEQPRKPAVDEGNVEPVVEFYSPTIKADVVSGLNLGGARSGGNAEDNSAKFSGATGEDTPEVQEASSGSLAGILSAIAVAVVGAIVAYFTYQKKKLCFKNRQEADPEAARKADATEAESDPQVLSNLLNSS